MVAHPRLLGENVPQEKLLLVQANSSIVAAKGLLIASMSDFDGFPVQDLIELIHRRRSGKDGLSCQHSRMHPTDHMSTALV